MAMLLSCCRFPADGVCLKFNSARSLPERQEVEVRQCRVAPAIFVLLSASPAFGQYAAVIQACSRDLMQLCAPAQRGGTPLTECVTVHFQEFTEPCKAALVRIAPV